MLLRRQPDRGMAFDDGEALLDPLHRPDDGAERRRIIGWPVFVNGC